MRLGSLITPEGVKAEIDRQYNWEKTEKWRNSNECKELIQKTRETLIDRLPELHARGIKPDRAGKAMSQEEIKFWEFMNSKEGFEKIKQDAEDFYMMNISQQRIIAAGREKEDVFWNSTGNQWMIFSNYLYDINSSIFGEGRQENKVEEILSTITADMDTLSRSQYVNLGIGICFSKGGGGKAFPSKSQLLTELEMSMSGLKYIADNYVDDAHKAEFENLVQTYHKHNMDIIDEYENPFESFYKVVDAIRSSGYFNCGSPTPDHIYASKLGNIHKTLSQKKDYLNNLSNFFSNINKDNYKQNVDKLKDIFVSYVTDDSDDKDFRDYIANDCSYVFKHFVDLWAELGKL